MRCRLLSLCALVLAGCSDRPQEPTKMPPERWEYSYQNVGKLWDKDIVLYGKDAPAQISEALWYGALESLKAFPLKIVDRAAGILQTDWYIMEGYPHDRFQVRVTVEPSFGIQVNALKVVVLRQTYRRNQWELAPPSEALDNAVKHDILLNARTYAVKAKATEGKP